MAVMLMGFSMVPAKLSASHDSLAIAAAEAADHDQSDDAHGHSHDDDGNEGADASAAHRHTHGHNAADHTHDTPASCFYVTTLPCSFNTAWSTTSLRALIAGVPFRFERPPRGIVFA